MKLKAVRTIVAGVFVMMWTAGAFAYDCSKGGETIATTIQFFYGASATPEAAIWLKGRTSRSLEDTQTCPGLIRVEGWIDGDPHGAMSHNGNGLAQLGYPGDTGPGIPASCAAGVPYTAHTKHWFIKDGWFGDPWISIANKNAAVTSTGCPSPPPPSEQELCEDQGPEYYWDGGQCVFTPGSPIIVDTARDGYKLTSVDDGVRFDLNADGVAELVAWTRVASDDAFLAIDRNGNGRIDDGSELIGNYTRAYADREDVRTRNGFEALKFLEGPSYGRSNGDGTIDANDGVFGRLLLWKDLNHNGTSEPDELQPIRDAGIKSIGTDYQEKRRIDRYGNEFRQKGRLIWASDIEDAVFDVWLKWRP